jgi:hypothetical protein
MPRKTSSSLILLIPRKLRDHFLLWVGKTRCGLRQGRPQKIRRGG